MRISDWSSDVCSSDLHGRAGIGAVGRLRPDELCAECAPGGSRAAAGQQSDHLATERGAVADQPGAQPREPAALLAPADPAVGPADAGAADRSRSEEHTSELQSLMRISYAVFCLKKKNKNTNN